ncbi:hypothetical protein E8E11_008190 [Didymella keratinophila]|nr:hypothetical protein E8E11_008190 [Didymella keratinophila]
MGYYNEDLTLSVQFGNQGVETRRNLLNVSAWPSIDIIRALDFRAHKFAAYTCDIVPCVRSYSAKVSGSILREKLESEYNIQLNNDTRDYAVADLSCVNTTARAHLQQMGYKISADQQWLDYNVTVQDDVGLNDDVPMENPYFTGVCKDIPDDQVETYCDKEEGLDEMPDFGAKYVLKPEYASLVPAECVYSLAGHGLEVITGRLLPVLLMGVVTEAYNTTPPDLEGPEPVLALWHAGTGNGTFDDIDGIMRNISDALTAYIRQNGKPWKNKPASGTVYYNTVCIHVRWVWMAYSVAVVVLTLVFFIWVVMRSRRDQSGLLSMWGQQRHRGGFHDFKSSALTLLFHGFDADSLSSMADVGSTNREGELDRLSKVTKVQLVATSQGWKLSTTAS